MKKFLSIITSAFMAIALFVGTGGGTSLVVKADEGTANGKITIKNTVTGEQYNVYKIFDATTGNATSFDATGSAEDSRNAAYTYTKVGATDAFLTALQGNDSPFTLTQQGSLDTYNVELKADKNANDIVTFLNGQFSNITSKKVGETHTATAKTTGSQEGSDITIDSLSYGYYYITTTTGSAVTINSAVNEVTVEDKNSVPSIDKKQSLTSNDYTENDLSANIGDTVNYQITITAGKTNNNTYTVTDTLSNGLTLDTTGSTAESNLAVANLSVQKFANGTGTGTDLTVTTDYSVSDISAQGFKLTVTQNYVKDLSAGDTIVIKYSAKINSSAVIAGEGNTNTAQLKYSNQTTEDKTTVKTYQFDLVKTKDKAQTTDTTYEVLPGAKFKLYKGGSTVTGNNDAVTKADGATAIYFKKANATPASDDTNKAYTTTYTVTTETSGENVTDTIEAGNVRIIGLGTGTYALEETEAPSGYNKLTYVKKVTVNDANNVATVSAATTEGGASQYTSGGVQVINKAGSLLPSTGGIGTTIFYVAGIVLVAGAAVLLINKKHKQNA